MQASRALSSMLAPLYGPYCMCRVRMSSLEEHFITKEGGGMYVSRLLLAYLAN